jgi:hypothetical protein
MVDADDHARIPALAGRCNRQTDVPARESMQRLADMTPVVPMNLRGALGELSEFAYRCRVAKLGI